jgi:hypothetical protein
VDNLNDSAMLMSTSILESLQDLKSNNPILKNEETFNIFFNEIINTGVLLWNTHNSYTPDEKIEKLLKLLPNSTLKLLGCMNHQSLPDQHITHRIRQATKLVYDSFSECILFLQPVDDAELMLDILERWYQKESGLNNSNFFNSFTTVSKT